MTVNVIDLFNQALQNEVLKNSMKVCSVRNTSPSARKKSLIGVMWPNRFLVGDNERKVYEKIKALGLGPMAGFNPKIINYKAIVIGGSAGVSGITKIIVQQFLPKTFPVAHYHVPGTGSSHGFATDLLSVCR